MIRHRVQVVKLQVLPGHWSLYYAFAKTKWWREFRKRVQEFWGRDFDKCPKCPKRCPAKVLDEKWEYDNVLSVKCFLTAQFICSGCHWLKSPAWRRQTWRKRQAGLLPPPKSEHIKDCLGWSNERVEELRLTDMREEASDKLVKTFVNFVSGRAEPHQLAEAQAVAKDIGALPADRNLFLLCQILEKGEIWLEFEFIPWELDLSSLAKFGYSESEINQVYVQMQALARKRLEDGEWYWPLNCDFFELITNTLYKEA